MRGARSLWTTVSAMAAVVLAGCAEAPIPAHLRIEGADAERGRRLVVAEYGCGACHTIDAVRSARGMVGPPLTAFAQRKLFAGRFPNAPRFLVPWLIDPTALAPQTGMPNLGVTDRDARDIAAFLYTLGADEVAVFPPLPAYEAGARTTLRAALPRESQERAAAPSDAREFVRVPIERAMRYLADQK
jgi:cytochrome c2